MNAFFHKGINKDSAHFMGLDQHKSVADDVREYNAARSAKRELER